MLSNVFALLSDAARTAFNATGITSFCAPKLISLILHFRLVNAEYSFAFCNANVKSFSLSAESLSLNVFSSTPYCTLGIGKVK